MSRYRWEAIVVHVLSLVSLSLSNEYGLVRHFHSTSIRYGYGASTHGVVHAALAGTRSRPNTIQTHTARSLTHVLHHLGASSKGNPTELIPHSKSKAATIVQFLMQVQGRACSPGNQGAPRLSRPDVTKPRPSPRPHRATGRRRPPHPPHLPCPRQGPCRQAYPSCLRGPRACT